MKKLKPRFEVSPPFKGHGAFAIYRGDNPEYIILRIRNIEPPPKIKVDSARAHASP